MENKVDIGLKIKNKRLQLNLRMDDLARKVGITRSTLWSIENGKGNYSIDTLIKIVTLLNMSFDVKMDGQGNRKRASRVIKAIDKKINRFVVMCVEQYAAKTNQRSGETYIKLSEAGVIDELKDVYEDMHGMSTYSINEYIDKRLMGL